MELTWYGLGCFRISERGYPTVLTDPFDEERAELALPRVRVDIVTSSWFIDEPENARWKGIRGVSHTIAGPGEYEIGGVFLAGVTTFRDRKRGALLGQNIVYSFNVNGVVVCHLGELGSTPTQAQIEAMGRVNVLLIPVGIPDGLSLTMASEIISLIEPDVVVPMHYKTSESQEKRMPVTRFLKEMGVAQSSPVPMLKLSSGSIPEEPQIVLLEPQQKEE